MRRKEEMWLRKFCILAFFCFCVKSDFVNVKENLFCVQFYNGSRPNPLRLTVNETFPVGDVLIRFRRPEDPNSNVLLNEGDTDFLTFDHEDLTIRIKQSLKIRRNSVLNISGNCYHFVKEYDEAFLLPVIIYIRVVEFNDPPVFLNLPTTLEVEEVTEKNANIFIVRADDIYDVSNASLSFELISVTNKINNEKLENVFSLTTDGQVRLLQSLDFDEGVRQYDLLVEVMDTGRPPKTNKSVLTIQVLDSDDQPPKFTSTEYVASVIGEKPIKDKQCFKTQPPLNAEDQDPVAKSVINYQITNGTPKFWPTFFYLDPEKGVLCQIKTIERLAQHGYAEELSFSSFRLNVEAFQIDNKERKDRTTLLVNVRDLNIHAPVFTQNLYRTKVNEFPELKHGIKVAKVTAYDKDYGRNKLFRYEIIQNYKNAFSVDADTGDITVAKPRLVDREQEDMIQLKVKAYETHSAERLESKPHARIVLSVLDVNDNSPQFKKMKFKFMIKDNHLFNDLVHPENEGLLASDPDLAENGTIVYSINRVTRMGERASFSDIQRFRIDGDGNLYVAQSLRDLRRKTMFPEYQLLVKAEDQTKNHSLRRSTTALVSIQVLEANDFPPVFKEQESAVSVSEATSIGSRVTKLDATDQDGDEDIYLTYSIVSGNDENSFSISRSGYLTTAVQMDREKKSSYNLTVQVSDGVHKARATVIVKIDDVNDHAPSFSQQTFEFFLPENATSGYVIGSVIAKDKDIGENGRITYSLSRKGAQTFGITNNGEIFVREHSDLIDKEKNDHIVLQVKATDAGDPPNQDVAGVNIEIMDVNDNAPIFNHQEFQGYLLEEQSDTIGGRVVNLEHPIEAVDADKMAVNRNIKFTLRGDGSDKFVINSRTGVVRVMESSSIDCELKCEYNLTVVACDKGGFGLESRADLRISVQDINDNAPQFEMDYIIDIQPLTPIGTKIHTIHAVDKDVTTKNNKIMYLLRSGGAGKFQLDFDTGDLSILDMITREPQKEMYELEIQALDTGIPRMSSKGRVLIRVPVNRDPVVEDQFIFEIDEDVPVGYQLGNISTFDPNKILNQMHRLEYVIQDKADLPFVIESKSGILKTSTELDAEKATEYMFAVFIADNGIPPLTSSTSVSVYVKDINDNAPKFSELEYVGSIMEDDSQSAERQSVAMGTRISTSDDDMTLVNQEVTYSLSGDGSDYFIMDPLSAHITVKTPNSLDSERNYQYNLTIHATDQQGKGLESTAQLLIQVDDVNDNAPLFEEDYSFDLDPLLFPGSIIGKIKARDKDRTAPNNRILYLLTNGSFGKFSLDITSGTLTLVESLLEEPLFENYNLSVQVFDFGQPQLSSSAQISVTVPLNYPPELLSKYKFQVLENLPSGTVIGQVTATDRNLQANSKEKLRYYYSNTSVVPFEVNSDTGTITTTEVLDKEVMDSYYLVLFVTDNGVPTYTASTDLTITIMDVNDNAPVFSSSKYEAVVVEDDSKPKENLLLQVMPTVSATDKDVTKTNNQVRYKLKGKGSELFFIDPVNGSVEQRRKGTIDCEKQSIYKLKVIATDDGSPANTAEAEFIINVQDVNDNAPIFEQQYVFQTPRLTSVGATVGIIKAVDIDVSEKYHRVSYFLDNGAYDKFAIDRETGFITVADNLTREPLQEEYVLNVWAADAGDFVQTSISQVIIQVPFNNKPILPPKLIFTVLEDIPITGIISKVEALDPDIETIQQDYLEYSINDESGMFLIEKHSGQLQTLMNLDADKEDRYIFTLTAKDHGIPPYTATTTVFINVEDVNDNLPEFTSPNGYKVTVPEGFQGILPVHPQVSIEDLDVKQENRAVEFRLKGAGKNDFEIDSASGQIFVKQGNLIDCEKKCQYDLQLEAFNKNDKRSRSEANLTIFVEDVNDHGPIFMERYLFHIGAATKAGTVIGKLHAEDGDWSSKNNRLAYFLKAGGLDKFSVDSVTGDILVADDLNQEPRKEHYNLFVQVVDFGEPQMSTNTTAKVFVPVNHPIIVDDDVAFWIYEDARVGSKVGKVNASDPDLLLGSENALKFFIPDQSVPFSIRSHSGIIQTKARLDAETKTTYQFLVEIEDNDVPPMTATTSITVNVEDVNDNAPIFSAQLYKASIVEYQQGNDRQQTLAINPPLEAKDGDLHQKNKDIRYYFHESERNLFMLDSDKGFLQITDASFIDCEQQSQYNITIIASDGKFESKADLIIMVEDINDNRPRFLHNYSYQVGPLTASGMKIGHIQALDGDTTTRNNRVLYVLLGGSSEKFGIDFVTGELYVASDLTIDPHKEEYKLIVQAIDTGEPNLASNTTVRIRVALNKPPVLPKEFVFHTAENQTRGTVIGTIAVLDPDIIENPNEKIRFKIKTATSPFVINEELGTVRTLAVLDRENADQYLFTVMVENDGAPSYTVSTSVTVFIDDINDNAPIFSSATGYFGTYVEGDATGVVKLNQEITVTDNDKTDKNRNLTLEILGDGVELFSFDARRGTLSVRLPETIDCEKKAQYDLKVVANDQGQSGHKTVSQLTIKIEDINDNVPHFNTRYQFKTPINSKPGTKIGTAKANDADCSRQNNRITYLLKDGGFGKFRIDSDRGDILIADSLIREPIKDEYKLIIQAMDNGDPVLSESMVFTVSVPLNQPPVIHSYTVMTIQETTIIGLEVGKVLAYDPDLLKVPGEKLYFYIKDTVPFEIESATGIIKTNNFVDREETEFFLFEVFVKDNGMPSYTVSDFVKIFVMDINDNAPHFIHGKDYKGIIVEDDRKPMRYQQVTLTKNLSVIDFDATEENQKVTFSLKGKSSKLFYINRINGEIFVAQPGKIDRELHKEYHLKIVATDRSGKGLSTEADLCLEVQDVNDHSPRFVQSTYEFVLPSVVNAGYKVGQLLAIDRDATSPNNRLLYIFETDALGKFKIDISTGELTLLEGFFSKPRKTTYTFSVAAVDMGFPSRKAKAEVIINAPHMVYNDHPPKFEGRNVFIMKEEIPIGSLVGRLKVTDEDKMKNSSITLTIDPADQRYVPFAVKNDGSIVTTENVNRDAGYEYFRFTVHAKDQGAPPFNATQEVGIIVEDINDNPPHFTMNTYRHMISDLFPPFTTVATPFAYDDIDKRESVYLYYLKSKQSYFYIDKQTGIIRTTEKASSLKSGRVHLTVVAQDAYNKDLTASARVVIQVIHLPQHSEKPQNFLFRVPNTTPCCRVPC